MPRELHTDPPQTNTVEYDNNFYRYQGDTRVGNVLLYSYRGKDGPILDITDSTATITIYQSIDNNFITGDLLLNDTKGLYSKFPIIGQEFLEFKMRTPIMNDGDEEIDFTNFRLHVHKAKAIKSTQNAQAVLLSFSSVELSRNQRVKVSQSMSGTYGEMVDKMIKGKKYLNSKKVVMVDDTKGNDKIVFPNLRPVDAVNMLASIAEPQDFKSAGYKFFENKRGFHFRCIESLYRSAQNNNELRPFIAYYDLRISGQPSFDAPALNPTEILQKPYGFRYNTELDTVKSSRLGHFASKNISHDMFTKTYNTHRSSYTELYYRKLHIDNVNSSSYHGMMPPGAAELDDEHTPDSKTYGLNNPKILSALKKTPIGQSYNRSKYSDYFDSRLRLIPDTSNLHENITTGDQGRISADYTNSTDTSRFISITIEAPGNFTVAAGDLVWVDYPEFVEEVAEEHNIEDVNPMLSGRYLVKSVNHTVDLVANNHRMSIIVERDIFSTYQELPTYDFPEYSTKVTNVLSSAISTSTYTPIDKTKGFITLQDGSKKVLDTITKNVPSAQIQTVEDVIDRLGFKANSLTDAQNKAVNAVVNSTTNRVKQNKYIAAISDKVAESKSVINNIVKNVSGIALPNVPTSIEGIKQLGLSKGINAIASQLKDNAFVKSAITNFKQFRSSATSFIKGLF